MPTLADVAKRAGVSTATVSRVLSNTPYFTENTKQKVLAAADALGYVPHSAARALASGRTNIVAFVYPYIEEGIADDPAITQILQGVEDEARCHGYHVLMVSPEVNADEEDLRFRNIIASRNIDGTQIALDNLLGQGAIVLAALLFAWTTVYTRRTLRDQPVSPLALAVGASTVSGVFMLAWFLVSLLFGATLPAISTLQTDTLFSIFMLGVFNTLIAVVLANYVIRELGASRANMQAYIVPIIALVLGAIFLDEVIDLTVIVGSVVILFGVAIATFGSRLGRAVKFKLT